MGDPRTLSDAEERYLTGIRTDLEGLLGPDIALAELRCDDVPGGGIELVARYVLGEHERESRATGLTLLDAHAELRTRIVTDRVGYSFEDLATAVLHA